MIRNDQIESLSVISTGSNSSYNSSASSSSTSSTSSSCCSSQMSNSTPMNCSSQSNSPNSSLSLSTGTSPVSGNYYRNVALNTTNYEQISYDFSTIMGDLTNVCGTLNILAKQIDQIVHKIDDKFKFMLDGLAPQDCAISNNQHGSLRKNDQTMLKQQQKQHNAPNNNPIDMIKDLKKLNDCNMSLIHNTVEQNCKHLDTLKQHQRAAQQQQVPNTVAKACIYANCSTLAGSAQELSKSVEKSAIQCKNIASIAVVGSNSSAKTCSMNSNNKPSNGNNEAALMNMLNKSGTDQGRSMSTIEKKSANNKQACQYTNDTKSESYQHRYNTLDQQQPEGFGQNQRNRYEYWSQHNNKAKNLNACQRNYEAAQKFLASQQQQQDQQQMEQTSSLRRCTRSKSQPAFNKAPIEQQQEQNPELNQHYPHKNVCSIINNNSSFGANIAAAGPFTQHSMFDFKTKDDSLIITKNKQENGRPESSFYEDQLDNELENIESPTLETPMLEEKGISKTNTFNKPEDTLTSPTRKVAFDTDTVQRSNRKQSKSASGNHHVSFNINNAIYSTRQEIPISIIKNSNASPSISNGSNGTMPIQSALKKSTTSSALQDRKASRTADTKTTIL